VLICGFLLPAPSARGSSPPPPPHRPRSAQRGLDRTLNGGRREPSPAPSEGAAAAERFVGTHHRVTGGGATGAEGPAELRRCRRGRRGTRKPRTRASYDERTASRTATVRKSLRHGGDGGPGSGLRSDGPGGRLGRRHRERGEDRRGLVRQGGFPLGRLRPIPVPGPGRGHDEGAVFVSLVPCSKPSSSASTRDARPSRATVAGGASHSACSPPGRPRPA
jgi:hypothetical protein